MAKKDDVELSDDYEMDDFGDFLDDSSAVKREPPKNTREAVSYAASDVKAGIKEGFSSSNLTSNLTAMTKNLAPKAISQEMSMISGVKNMLGSETDKILKENKDKLANISGFIMSKSKSGGLINKLATKLNDRVADNNGSNEESVESIAQRVVSSELESAMSELANSATNTINSYTQQEALNRIYTTLLRTDVFNRSITTTYYRKSLEYQYIHLATTKKIHDLTREGFNKLDNALSYVVKNTSLPDIVKLRSTEAIQAQARQKLTDIGFSKLGGSNGLLNILARKIANKKDSINSAITGVESGLENYKSAQEMNEMMAELGGGSPIQMMASTIPGMLMGSLGGLVGNRIARTRRGSIAVDKFKDIASSPSEALRGVSSKLGTGSNIYTSYIKSKLASGASSLADMFDTGDGAGINRLLPATNMAEAATIDKRTLVTQNEVVPSLLSKIWKEIHLLRTGADDDSVDEPKFDYSTRSFTTTKGAATKLTSKISKVLKGSGASADITSMSNYILTQSGVEYSDAEVGEVKKGLTSFLLTGKAFNPSNLDDSFYKHFSKPIADKIRASMGNVNSDKNVNRGTQRATMRDLFSTAKSKIPNIDNIIESQIESGNTDALLKAGLITYDEKTGGYRVNSSKYSDMISSSIASYQGRGYDVGSGIGTNDDIIDKFGRFRKKVSSFRTNMSKNLNSNYVFNQSNIPGANSMFTINKSGTNSMAEKLSTDIGTKSSKIFRDVKDSELATSMKETLNSGIDILKSTDTYKVVQKLVTEELDKLDLGRVRMLKGKEILEASKIIASSEAKELKANISTYLYSIGAINMKDLRENLTPESIKANITGKLGSKFKGVRDSKIVEDMLKYKDTMHTKISDTLEEAIEKKEDMRIESIVSNVLERVESNKENISKTRVGSWMEKNKKGKRGNESTDIGEDITKAVENEDNPLWSIAKLLMMGIPALVSKVTGMFTGIGSIATLLKAFPTMFGSLFGGLTKTIVGALAGRGMSGGVDISGATTSKKSKAGMLSKLSGIGGKVFRKLPVIGAVVGAGYAASQLMGGDIIGGAGTLTSSLIGSIPLIGTAASFGVDYLVDAYKDRNPDINKDLYKNVELPPISMEDTDKITLNHIRKHETGRASGTYGIAKDIGDGAGVSFGAYQFTEKSGNIKEYVRRIVELTGDPVGKAILGKFNNDNIYTGSKTGLIKYLKETGDTTAGRYVQDSMYKQLFLEPAKKLASEYGVTDPASISQIVDHSVNAGLGGAKRVLYNAGGDYTPNSIARARKMDYINLIRQNRKLAKYQNNWLSRVDSNASMFISQATAMSKSSRVDEYMITDTNGNRVAVSKEQYDKFNESQNSKSDTFMSDGNKSPIDKIKAEASKFTNGASTTISSNKPTSGTNTAFSGIAPTSSMISNKPVMPVISTAKLESIMSDTNGILRTILTNTAMMVDDNKVLVSVLSTLADKATVDKAIASNNTKKNTSNTTTVVKVPMGTGISTKRGSSI